MSHSTKVKCLDMFSQVQLGMIWCDYFSQLPVKHNDHDLKIYLFVYQTFFWVSRNPRHTWAGAAPPPSLPPSAHDFSSVSVSRFHSFSWRVLLSFQAFRIRGRMFEKQWRECASTHRLPASEEVCPILQPKLTSSPSLPATPDLKWFLLSQATESPENPRHGQLSNRLPSFP